MKVYKDNEIRIIDSKEYGEYLKFGYKKLLIASDFKIETGKVRVFKDGIYKKIEESELKTYLAMGFKKTSSSEPQPEQFDLYVIDDYTIGKISEK